MDPLTLVLAGLNVAGSGYNYHQQNRLNRGATALGRDQHNAEIRAADNSRAQMMEDNLRQKRMLEEALASRGVEDSTIARDEMNYMNRGQERGMQGANDRSNLARRSLQQFNRGVKTRRRGNYINLGLGLANAFGGAYGAM